MWDRRIKQCLVYEVDYKGLCSVFTSVRLTFVIMPTGQRLRRLKLSIEVVGLTGSGEQKVNKMIKMLCILVIVK